MAWPKSRSFVAAYWARTTSTSSCDIAAVSRDGLLREGQDLLVLQRRLQLEVEELRGRRRGRGLLLRLVFGLCLGLDRECLGRLRLGGDRRAVAGHRVLEQGIGDGHEVGVEVAAQHVAQKR